MGDNDHCSIVGLLGIIIQVILGVLSFSVLVIKRHYQDPKRPWKVWCFDTMKQGISQLLAHFLNLTISLALNESDPNSDTCLWYFITNIFDNTFGVFLSVMILRRIEKQMIKRKKTHLVSGHYYQIIDEKEEHKNQIGIQPKQVEQQIELTSPKIIINYRAWVLQLALWNGIFLVSKILVFISQLILDNILDQLSHFLLGWIEEYPDLELILVIVVVPVFMNGLAFWIVDNFLKKRDITTEMEEIQAEKQVEMKETKELQKQSHQQIRKKQNERQEVSLSPDIKE